jgi:hypothetical protein
VARYNIVGINYIASGENRSFINMDIELEYQLYDLVHLLCVENETSGYTSIEAKNRGESLEALSVDIGTENGVGKWIKTNFIQKGNNEPLSKELCSVGIILNEQQNLF